MKVSFSLSGLERLEVGLHPPLVYWHQQFNQQDVTPEFLSSAALSMLSDFNDEQWDVFLQSMSMSPYPWPWCAADVRRVTQHYLLHPPGGYELLLGLAVYYDPNPFKPAPLPSGLIQGLEQLGVKALPYGIPLDQLKKMGFYQRALLNTELVHGTPLVSMDSLVASRHLSVMAMPLLYTPSVYGPYEALDGLQKGFLMQSLSDLLSDHQPQVSAQAPSWRVAFVGHYEAALQYSHAITPSLVLAQYAHQYADLLKLPMDQLAVSVSFHRVKPAPFMRVALRTLEEGFVLEFMDWEAPVWDTGWNMENEGDALDGLFDQLLHQLTLLGIEYCFCIDEPFFEAWNCPTCSRPMVPAPDHEPWRQSMIDSQLPPDGSHLHP